MADKRARVKLYMVAIIDYSRPKKPAIVEVGGSPFYMVAVPETAEDVDAYVGMRAGAICAEAGIDVANVEPQICPFGPTR